AGSEAFSRYYRLRLHGALRQRQLDLEPDAGPRLGLQLKGAPQPGHPLAHPHQAQASYALGVKAFAVVRDRQQEPLGFLADENFCGGALRGAASSCKPPPPQDGTGSCCPPPTRRPSRPPPPGGPAAGGAGRLPAPATPARAPAPDRPASTGAAAGTYCARRL